MFLDSEEELEDEDFSRLLSPLRKGRFNQDGHGGAQDDAAAEQSRDCGTRCQSALMRSWCSGLWRRQRSLLTSPTTAGRRIGHRF